ncbi:EI24 domain-containing protein [Cellulophaga sp. HaHa_2_95]|uniref:EI24 domain-containing protein n=1 Tax=unclassified Cellulophaga TaxID=2634405 RepID=UPI001C4FB61C|nr:MULTISPECIES: EI24 domain-containing protein [unclassified Cellulophaga]QXP51229.1 EI24 domain-containing protein [Cellulophaga sp. HaHa_2_1]QXP56440.1 EI24 domain-containing protein [Cellulophaga sp. HaHa_2_95]
MFKNILVGIKSYSGTFKLMKELKLWKYFFIPMVISLITASLIGVAAWSLSSSFGEFIATLWIWDFGKDTFTSISTLFSGLIILVVGFILYKHIVMALSAPFMSPVSEKIEAHLTGVENHDHKKTSFNEQLWRGIKINIRNLGKELLYTLPLLLLKLIPVVNIFSAIALFLLQAYYAGFGSMDYTLERHFNYKDSIDFVRKNRGVAIGNGIIFMLFLFIPVIGIIIVLPLSVTAASIKTIGIIKKTN